MNKWNAITNEIEKGRKKISQKRRKKESRGCIIHCSNDTSKLVAHSTHYQWATLLEASETNERNSKKIRKGR